MRWRYFLTYYIFIIILFFKATSLLNWCVGCQSHNAPEKDNLQVECRLFCRPQNYKKNMKKKIVKMEMKQVPSTPTI